MTEEIQRYDKARIEKLKDVAKLVTIKNSAEAARIFYKAQDMTEEAQKFQELKIRGIRQAGVILLPPKEGGQTEREPGKGGHQRSSGCPTSLTPYQQALEEAGIQSIFAPLPP